MKNTRATTLLLTFLLAAPALAAAQAPAQEELQPSRHVLAVYRVAPGKHRDFLRWVEAREKAAQDVGAPPARWFFQQTEAGWEFVSLSEVPAADVQARLEKKLKKLPRGVKATTELRDVVIGQEEASGLGPFAADELAREVAKREKAMEKPKPAPGHEPGSEPVPTRRVLSRIVREFQSSFEALSPRGVVESLDEENFYDYPRFEENVTEFLRSLGELRLFIREVNVQIEGDRAVMIVDAEMSFAPRGAPEQQSRRRQQITFDFLRTPEGWKITEINPRVFFFP